MFAKYSLKAYGEASSSLKKNRLLSELDSCSRFRDLENEPTRFIKSRWCYLGHWVFHLKVLSLIPTENDIP